MRNINFQHPFAQATCISLIHIYLNWANHFMQYLEKLRADSHSAAKLSEAAGVFKGKRTECLSVTHNSIDHVGGVHCPQLWCKPVDSAERLPWPLKTFRMKWELGCCLSR